MLTLNDGRSELWQWDTGRKLTVDADCTQVHFSNKFFGRSVDVDVVDGVAEIPDVILQVDKDLLVWAFVGTAENGYTKISKVFKVNKRNKPADYVFTPPEQTTLGELIERLDKIEESQDPDAIKNAVGDYLANNPIKIDETDPTVSEWAKQPTKPSYTASEVGALPDDTVIPTIPENVSAFRNDAGYLTEHQDLTGYATERYVQGYAQPKGDYLTAIPDGYAKIEDIPTRPEDIGAQPSGNYALKSEIPSVPVQSVNGKTGAVKLGAADVGARPSNWMPTAQEVGALPDTYVPPNQTAAQVGADPAGTAAAVVSTHNTSTDSHGDLRLELKAINDRLTAFFDSDNQTLDELSEIVAYITSNKALIDSITTSKVSVADIINNLTTNVANKPLSAAQGVALKGLIDAVGNSLSNYQPKGDYALRSELPTVPTKVSQLQNDKGYLTEHQDISGKLDADKLPEAVNDALAQAKKSGEFDGKDGKDGQDYVLTDDDKTEIAEQAATVIAAKIEPADDDMPKVFLTGDEFSDMTTEKNEVNMELDYRSKTDSFHAFIAIKFQGSTSLRYDKKNFTVKLFDDEAHTTKQKHLFRDWKYAKNKFVLKANYIDHSHARNIMGANLWNEVVASRSDYSNLPEELRNSPQNGAIDGFPIKLYVNGTYQGVYTWNIGKDDWMWGMDEDNANHYLIGFGHNSDGEFKLRPYNFRALWSGVGTDGSYVEIEIGTSGDALTTSVNNLISFVMNNDGSAFRNGIGTYLDVQSAIDYYIHQYVICGLDGLAKNMLLGSYDGKKWYCGAYDMDSTFGLYWNGSKFVSAQYKCPEDYQERFSLLWERLESNFWSEIKTRYAELRKTVYSIGNVVTHFERFMDTIGLDLYAEDLTIYPNIPNGSTNNIQQLRNFIRDRLTYCDQQITNGIPGLAITLGNSEVSVIPGGTVTLTANVTPANTTDEILWLTSNPAVATISGGVVKGVSEGSCEIRAKCGSGYAVCTVIVAAAAAAYINLVPTAEERILDGDAASYAEFAYDGVGYSTNARLSSSGFVKKPPYFNGIVTGFIPAAGGDVVRIGGIRWCNAGNSQNYLCAYKNDYTYVGAVYGQDNSSYGTAISASCVIDYDTPLTTITLKDNDDIAFIRVGCIDSTMDLNGENLIVTVNEEIV